jgi:hypothetical protein
MLEHIVRSLYLVSLNTDSLSSGSNSTWYCGCLFMTYYKNDLNHDMNR